MNNRSIVYVGVTGNIEERLRRHNAREVIFRGQTANQDVAAAVEDEARRRVFISGKSSMAGTERTAILYMYMHM